MKCNAALNPFKPSLFFLPSTESLKYLKCVNMKLTDLCHSLFGVYFSTTPLETFNTPLSESHGVFGTTLACIGQYFSPVLCELIFLPGFKSNYALHNVKLPNNKCIVVPVPQEQPVGGDKHSSLLSFASSQVT